MPADYEKLEIDDLKERIKQQWSLFLNRDLPQLRTAVAECFPADTAGAAQS